MVVVPADGAPVAEAVRSGLAAFAKDAPDVTTSVATATTGDASQSSLIDELVSNGTNAIVVFPRDAEAVAPALARASAARVVVVTTGIPDARRVAADLEPWDETSFGRRMMDVMAAWMGYAGQWAALVDSGTPRVQSRRRDGEIAEAAAAYPGLVRSVDAIEAADRAAARAQVIDLLKAHPGLKAILANSPAALVGTAQAVTEAGLIGKVGVFGTSYPSEAADHIRSGAVIAVTFSAPADLAYAALRAAHGLMLGQSVGAGADLGRPGYDRVTVMPNAAGVPVIYGSAWMTVNRDNLKDWIRPDGSCTL